MDFPNEITVTDQPIDISALTDAQITYYQEFADRLAKRFKEAGEGRQVFSLSGPPGSGKSVVTALLEYIFMGQSEFRYVNIGLDAFHHPNQVLAERKLLDVKGRYDTYDTTLLLAKLSAFLGSEAVSFPYYSRQDHNPVSDQITITETNVLLFLEGQWLLRNAPDWAEIRKLSAYNLAISGPTEALRENVIRRHMRGGRTMEDAMDFYAKSDLVNAHEITKCSVEPDETLLYYANI